MQSRFGFAVANALNWATSSHWYDSYTLALTLLVLFGGDDMRLTFAIDWMHNKQFSFFSRILFPVKCYSWTHTHTRSIYKYMYIVLAFVCAKQTVTQSKNLMCQLIKCSMYQLIKHIYSWMTRFLCGAAIARLFSHCHFACPFYCCFVSFCFFHSLSLAAVLFFSRVLSTTMTDMQLTFNDALCRSEYKLCSSVCEMWVCVATIKSNQSVESSSLFGIELKMNALLFPIKTNRMESSECSRVNANIAKDKAHESDSPRFLHIMRNLAACNLKHTSNRNDRISCFTKSD